MKGSIQHTYSKVTTRLYTIMHSTPTTLVGVTVKLKMTRRGGKLSRFCELEGYWKTSTISNWNNQEAGFQRRMVQVITAARLNYTP